MISAGTAIRLGFVQAGSRWATGLFAALATMVEVFAGVVGMLGALAWLLGYSRAGPIALLTTVLCLLASRVLLTFVQGGAIRHGAKWLKGEATGTSLEEMFAAAPRSLAWLSWTLPLELLGMLWKWVGLAALLWAYGRALVTGHGGAGASFTLALFVTLALPLALLWAMLSRAALVAAVRDDVGPFVAASRALAWISARPGAFFAVLLVGLAGAMGAQLVLSIFGGAVSPDGASSLEHGIAEQLAGGVLAAFVAALFDLFILHGFTALVSAPSPVAPAAPAVAIAPVPDLPPPPATAL